MDDHTIIKHIGKGSFSNVYLCRKKNKASLSLLSFTGIYEYQELYEDDSLEEFIIKEVNIENLVGKYIKRKLLVKKKHIHDIKSVSITPYNNDLQLKMEELHAEQEYYYKRLTDLIDGEIEILKTLDNENIVRFYSSSMKNQTYQIKMEYCLYGDLYNILKDISISDDFTLRNSHGGFDNKFIMKYLIDTISGLKYLHDNNIIHRDIKLQNVLVKKQDNQFVFKLSDFGFSCYDLQCNLHEKIKQTDFDTNLHKKYFKLCGTPYYMAPEIIINMEEFQDFNPNKETSIKLYDKKIDLWSYGICLYELIFNKLPFSNKIYDARDLKTYFLNSTSQHDIYNLIDEKKIINKRLKTLLQKLLTINALHRISTHEVFNYIKQEFSDINENEDQNLEKWTTIRLDTNNKINDNNVNDNNNDINDNDNNVNVSSLLDSWYKINKTSSLIIKSGVDNNFMRWLLNKK